MYTRPLPALCYTAFGDVIIVIHNGSKFSASDMAWDKSAIYDCLVT